MIRPAVFALAIAALLTPRASGAQVFPMSFSEMVTAADVIVRAEVVTRHSAWTTTRDGRVIVTQVTFRVEDTLKGDARLQLLLEFLGGTVGDETMRFSEVPTFEVGERAVLFAHTRDLMVSPPSGQRRQPSRGHQPGGRGHSPQCRRLTAAIAKTRKLLGAVVDLEPSDCGAQLLPRTTTACRRIQ